MLLNEVNLCAESKKRLLADKLVSRKKAAGEEGVDDIKERLRAIRLHAVRDMGTVTQDFIKTILESGDNVSVSYAQSAQEAVLQIKRITGQKKDIYINRSNTIHELKPQLERSGYSVIDTYYNTLHQPLSLENEPKYFWQLPDVMQETRWESFSVNEANRLCNNQGYIRYDVTALIGASAAACDGSIYFVQHSQNISQLLRQAGTLIVLVSIDKILYEPEEAVFQAKCMGTFGLESLILELPCRDWQFKETEISKINAANQISNEKVHVIVLDNRRSRIAQSEFQQILTCIECHRCAIHCPTHNYFGKSPSNYPKGYLWSFLKGNHGALDLCVGCGNCAKNCPLDINITGLISLARSKRTFKPAFLNIDYYLANVWLLMKLAKICAPILNILLNTRIIPSIASKLGIKMSPMITNSTKIQHREFTAII